MVCGRDDGFLQSTVRAGRFILYDDPSFKIIRNRFNRIEEKYLAKPNQSVGISFGGGKTQQCICGGCGEVSYSGGVRHNAPRHNDARLRPIKLTQNYIDDIF